MLVNRRVSAANMHGQVREAPDREAGLQDRRSTFRGQRAWLRIRHAIPDLFRPKHLNGDPAVRLAALDELDADTLFRVACKDSSATVGIAPGTRLTSVERRAMWLQDRPTWKSIDPFAELSQNDVIEIILAGG